MTQTIQTGTAPRRFPVPRAPVLALHGRKLFALTLDGELLEMDEDAARRLVRAHMPIVCHGPQTAARLGIEPFPAYDVLELFAFVRPGTFCVPTPRGIARALHLVEPETPEDLCLSLRDAARHLLADLAAGEGAGRSDPAALAAMMGLAGGVNDGAGVQGWPWAEAVLATLGRQPSRADIRSAVKVWDKLPQWAVHAPPPPPGHHGVSAQEAQERLHKLLQRQEKEERPQQQDYAAALAHAFAPREDEADAPHVVVAEAGTGTGKTLGYLSPATVWAEKNGGAVWVSTYTRNLQRQIDAELEGLYGDPAAKARKVVTRKGRENYLCLLNLEEAAFSPAAQTQGQAATAVGLMLRWAAVTGDGDLAGRDFPGWLPGLVGRGRVLSLADRRGECIYSACPHFDRCFVEKSVRKAKRADIVIANHALVMTQGAANVDEMPQRYIFDEGHHVFEAADSAFAAHLSGTEAAELRRWLLGAETSQKSRLRGVRRRLEDLIAADDEARAETDALLEAALCLPGPRWRERLTGGEPRGALESFLALCRRQVLARAGDEGPYSLETDTLPPLPELPGAAAALSARLKDIQRPMLALAGLLGKKLEDEAETLDTDARDRLRFMADSLNRRGRDLLGAWTLMLDGLGEKTPDGFVDWFEVTRIDGLEHDTGFHRHYVDPARVFAQTLKPVAHGVVLTSATLRDASEEDPEGWRSGLIRAGAAHLDGTGLATRLFSAPSPFDYPAQTRVVVVKDVRKDSLEEVAGAFRALFSASNGGALGVFTAVQRLRAVHQRIAKPLSDLGLNLLAQHADALDISTLIDMFREDENTCLLGTDATRDGIDVPGRALRLVVYDRVPWPRPTLLHKARRAHFGRDYDDMLTRFRLKQAYGRLIRKSDDKGVFVMLNGALPSRLLPAFPPGVEVVKAGLKEAVEIIQRFL